MARETPIQSDLFFRALIEHSSDIIVLITPDSTITYANPSIATLSEYSAEEVVGKYFIAFLHPDDQEYLREQLSRLAGHAEETLSLEFRWRCQDGTWRWMEGNFTNLQQDRHVGAIVCAARDITRRKQISVFEQAARELLDSERTFLSLFESNLIGVMVTDQEGRIYNVNERLIQLLGYSRAELLNEHLRVKDFMVPNFRSARVRAWKTLITHGASLPEEKDYVRKDGSVFSALVVAGTINQERTRALVMLLDMSDRKEAERRQEEFLGMVTHELKTPLTAIVGYLELALLCIERLSESSLMGTSDLLGTLEAMLRQAQRQADIETRLVAELLDMSRVETQKFDVSLRPCNLITLVQQVIADQQQIAPAHRIELLLPAQSELPVAADSDRIEQVLTNYLTNAFKFSPPGQAVLVQLAVEGLMARVSVSDTGPGLTEEQQQHVWDRFYQAETEGQQSSNGGLGLGLYIVRTIIAQHQGQVGVESHLGQGTTFWFLLPLADEPTQTLDGTE